MSRRGEERSEGTEGREGGGADRDAREEEARAGEARVEGHREEEAGEEAGQEARRPMSEQTSEPTTRRMRELRGGVA